jgi:RNA polymerase-binding protein DksA
VTTAAPAKPAPAKVTKAASAKAAPAAKTAPATQIVAAPPAPATPAKAPAKAAAAAPAAPAPAKTTGKTGSPVLPGETPWTKAELAEIRKELDEQARELRGEISEAETAWAALQRDSGEGSGDDQADAGTKTFEREHEMSLAANSRDLLSQVERALQRLDNGTYGICENCGNPIGKARLQAFPRATLCVTCKQREERR